MDLAILVEQNGSDLQQHRCAPCFDEESTRTASVLLKACVRCTIRARECQFVSGGPHLSPVWLVSAFKSSASFSTKFLKSFRKP